MDKFINIKNNPDFFYVRGRQDVAKTLWGIVNDKKLICVYGKPGVGKTYLVKKIMGRGILDVDQHILKSKVLTHNFLEKVKNSSSNILIDNFDPDLPGSREIAEYGKPLSRGATVIICDSVHKIYFTDCLEILPFNEDEINVLWPGNALAAQRCKGNLHNFNFYIQFSHDKDIFRNPKEIINDLLTTKQDTYISNSLEEHGHSLSVVHENYIDSKISIEDMSEISDCISIADVYDTEIYKSNWEFMQYFQVTGIAAPCYYINGTLKSNKIRPGSCWSKHNNMKMRQGKIKKFRMDIDTIIFLSGFIKNDPTLALSYNIESSDIDVINHIRLRQKFKTSEVQCLKKRISSLYQ